MASFTCRSVARIHIRIDGDAQPTSAEAAGIIEEMIRSGVEEHFGLAETIEVDVEHVERAEDLGPLSPPAHPSPPSP